MPINAKQFTICYLHYDRENFICLYPVPYEVTEAEQRNAQLLIAPIKSAQKSGQLWASF